MSLITRCPACGTMFKVVPDQLRISEGWVRCGHCSEVFDANDNMQRAEAPQATPSPHSTAPAFPRFQPSVDPASTIESGFSSSIHTEVGDSIPSDLPHPSELREEAAVLTRSPLDEPFEIRPAESVATTRSAPVAVELEPEPEIHDLSFVRKARHKAFWRSPEARGLLALLGVVFAGLLLAQFGIQERDRLAATDPSLRPWLARLCQPFRCAIGSPKQIDSLSIEASQFTRLRGDAYRLTVTLRNQAAMPVAMPALELTLTDGQDQAVVRRVLTAQELAPNAGTLSANSEWTGSLGLAVASATLPSRVAGYRVLAFYP